MAGLEPKSTMRMWTTKMQLRGEKVGLEVVSDIAAKACDGARARVDVVFLGSLVVCWALLSLQSGVFAFYAGLSWLRLERN